MKRKTLIKSLAFGILLSSVLVSCKKKDTTVEPKNPYKTSVGSNLSNTDSVSGELAEPSAEVIYSIKGIGHGISVKCYDQTYKSTDTSYADITVYFALTKSDLMSGNYLQTLYPSKDSIQSKNFGIQDSIYIKVVKDSRSSVNNPIGKYALKVVQNVMPIESATSLLINDATFKTINLITKGQNNYFELWYKASVTPGNTYYLQYLITSNSAATLAFFNCDFWDKDGITPHKGIDGVAQDSINSHYVAYTVPAGQSNLFIRCYNTKTGTNLIKLVDVKP